MKDLDSNKDLATQAVPRDDTQRPAQPIPFQEINDLVLNGVPVGFNVRGGQTAEAVNKVAVAGGFLPAFAPGTLVMDLVAARKARFVRIYDEDESHCGRVGVWLVNGDDIVGLTPRHVASKFNLCSLPNMIADVTLPAGTRLRMGVTAQNQHGAQWRGNAESGGGLQYLLDAPRERIPERWFGPGRLLSKAHAVSGRV